MTVIDSSISTSRSLLVGVFCVLAACGSDESKNNVVVITQTNNNGMTTGQTTGGNNTTPNNGTSVGVNNTSGMTGGINAACPPEARPVYVVEADVDDVFGQGKLVRFDPQDRKFTEIGELGCPAFDGAQPFSMSVDRKGVAWVLYGSGELFEVSTADASCRATNFIAGQQGYDVFGMGFALNRPETEDETLYVAGGPGPGEGSPRIGYIRFPDMTLTDAAPIGGWPEMSGTAAAELWAFFPNPLVGTARVSRLIAASGEEVDTIPVDAVISGEPNAWAFAHWGGRFYLFYKSQTDASSSVFEVQKNGTVAEIIPDTGRYIVGAGVSTCAPLIIQ